MRYLKSAIIALYLGCAIPALAQQQCAPVDTVIRYLGDSHGEAPVAVMLSERGRIFVFAKKDGSSWTMLVESGDKLCIVLDGIDFKAVRWTDPGKGA